MGSLLWGWVKERTFCSDMRWLGQTPKFRAPTLGTKQWLLGVGPRRPEDVAILDPSPFRKPPAVPILVFCSPSLAFFLAPSLPVWGDLPSLTLTPLRSVPLLAISVPLLAAHALPALCVPWSYPSQEANKARTSWEFSFSWLQRSIQEMVFVSDSVTNCYLRLSKSSCGERGCWMDQTGKPKFGCLSRAQSSTDS